MQFLNTMVLYTSLCTKKDTKFHSALSGLSQLSQMNKLIDATCIEILSPTNCANVSLECCATVSGTRLQPHLVGLFFDCLSSSKDAEPPEGSCWTIQRQGPRAASLSEMPRGCFSLAGLTVLTDKIWNKVIRRPAKKLWFHHADTGEYSWPTNLFSAFANQPSGYSKEQ